MATAGWGAVGGGAWGATPSSRYQQDDEPPRQEAPSLTPGYGTSNAFAAQPDVPTTNERSQNQGGTAGFGSGSGAYGSAAAGGSSFRAPAGGSTMTEAELRRKEAELAAKEKQLKELEAKLTEEGVLKKKKNWPICYPLTYHNIAEEIPERGRRPVREGYVTWMALAVCLMWNWFCSCVMLGTKAKQKVPSWFLALIYMLLGIPLSWWLWYRHLYQGAQKDSAFHFVWFFMNFAIHTAFCIWAAIGFQFSAQQWSFAGWLTAISATDECTFCGVVYIVGAVCWSCLAAWSCWVLVDTFLYFRGKGGIKEAKEEAKKEAALAALRQQQGQPAVNQV